MIKLLRANFARLWKNKLFWGETAFMLGLGAFLAVGPYIDGSQANFGDNMMFYILFICFCSAIFCSMFLGTEYSDGTIRNKLIVGHFRSSIYLSNLITGFAAAMLMVALFLLSYCTLGSLLLEPLIIKINHLVLCVLISIFTVAAYVSIFNMLSMMITKKSSSAVTCFVLLLGLLLWAVFIQASLSAPEYVPSYELIDDALVLTEKLNPRYLQPAARKVYQFLFDVLPSGQSLQLSTYNIVHPYLLMLYSAVVCAVSTLFGIFAFKKKNLK